MSSRRKWVDPEDFHMMRRRAGLDIPAAATLLDVTERTIRNWEQSITQIPYAAFRLLKMVNGYVFTCPAWDNWFVRGDTLYSPTQRGFKPHELTYLANYLWMARKWLSEAEQRRSDAQVYAARHADHTLEKISSRDGKLNVNASPKVIAPLKAGLNGNADAVDNGAEDDNADDYKVRGRDSAPILVIRTLEENVISTRSASPSKIHLASNDDCYTLYEVNFLLYFSHKKPTALVR